MSDGQKLAPGELDTELRATLDARRQLGPDYDDVLAEGLGARIDAEIARRVEEKLAAERLRTSSFPPPLPSVNRSGPPGGDGTQCDPSAGSGTRPSRHGIDRGLAIASLALGIPLTAVAGGAARLPGVVVAWVGIVAIDVAGALPHRHRPD